jgi:hypothetical protein
MFYALFMGHFAAYIESILLFKIFGQKFNSKFPAQTDTFIVDLPGDFIWADGQCGGYDIMTVLSGLIKCFFQSHPEADWTP